VELDRGFIKVDEYQQTGEPGVYAIGDVVAGTPQLAHVATMEGHGGGGEHGGQAGHADQSQSHSGRTYTEPGIGSVGFTEAQARAQGLQREGRQVPLRGQQQGNDSGRTMVS
jgi:dihydrolipoamide dehydrogenase